MRNKTRDQSQLPAPSYAAGKDTRRNKNNEALNQPMNMNDITGEHRANLKQFIGKNDNFWAKVLRTDAAKLVQSTELNSAKTEAEYIEAALRMTRDTQLQTIEEMANDCLIRGKTGVRKERAAFFIDQKQLLQAELSQKIAEFSVFIEERYNELDTIKLPQLRQREERRLQESIEDFFNTIDELLARFNAILSEGVSRL